MSAIKQICVVSCLFLALTISLSLPVHAQIVNPGTLVGFNPQPDPPGFGLVTLRTDQTVRLNVTCFDHQVGFAPPDPCRGFVMFHDANGNTLREGRYDLAPGRSGFLQFAFPAIVGDVAGARLIIPCVIPDTGGRAIPSVEVFDNATGDVVQYENPASPRMSQFNNDLRDPGSIVGFNPQPDPPGFGLVTLRTGQIIRLNVACFEHPVDGLIPPPCRGDVMFHNAAGDILQRGSYDLKPGQAMTFSWVTPPEPDTNARFGINPCILPAPGGRAVPNVEVVEASTGVTRLLINPAVARMSQFQKR